MQPNPLKDWFDAWQAFQQTSDLNPWSASLEQFWKNFDPRSLNDRSYTQALQKLVDQSHGLFDVGRQLADAQDSDAWQEVLQKTVESFSKQFDSSDSFISAGLWQTPINLWQDFAGVKSASSVSDDLLNPSSLWANFPGIGFTREHQEALQELSRRWQKYQRAQKQYNDYLAEVGKKAAEKMAQELQQQFEEETPPQTIREFYNQWIQCSEEVYAEHAASDDYMHLHGELVNSLMSFKQQQRNIMDDWAEALNLPSRQEIDALHTQLKKTKQSNLKLKTELSALQKTVAELANQSKRQVKKTKKKISKKK